MISLRIINYQNSNDETKTDNYFSLIWSLKIGGKIVLADFFLPPTVCLPVCTDAIDATDAAE